MHTLVQKYIGPSSFYKKTAKLAVPLSITMLLSSALGIIDTMMVSWIGMVTPVGTASQIDSLCSMITYGAIGGISMFSAQFFGAKDMVGLKKSFGLSLVLSFGNGLLWFFVASFFGASICSFYMPDPDVVAHAVEYLNIFRFSFIIGGITWAFGYMYRSIGKATVPLVTSICSTVANITLNACLIFGLGPFPAMGVQGAALASVLAQALGLVISVSYAIKTKQPFLGTWQELFVLPKSFVLPIFKKILPLILNEGLFGFGSTLFVKAFGNLGTQSMDAYYVGNQIFNIFLFVVYGYGNAVSVLLGNLLGSSQIEQAKTECRYHLGLSFVVTLILMGGMILFAKPMVDLFALTNPVTALLAVQIVYVLAVKVSMRLFNFIIFSILRAGGESKMVQRLDSGIVWLVGLPTAFLCVYLFHMESIVLVLLLCQDEQLVRLVFGMKEVISNRWANDITKLVQE